MIRIRQTRATSTCKSVQGTSTQLVLRLPLIRCFALLHYCQVINRHVGHVSCLDEVVVKEAVEEVVMSH